MKRKVLILFLLALVALIMVGWLGRKAINRSIMSVEEASAPNQKLSLIREMFQDLLDAESSVRTYTITENSSALNSFGDAAYHVNERLALLGEITTDSAQHEILLELDSLVSRKFETLKRLIQVKESSRDSSVLDRIRADIETLRKKQVPEELSTIRDLYVDAENDDEQYEKLFGNSRESETASDSLFGTTPSQDLSSRQVDEALTLLSQKEYEANMARRRRELTLTQQDNRLMEQIRAAVNRFEEVEQAYSATRADRLTGVSENAKSVITAIMIAGLLMFAGMLLIIFRDISRNQRNREQLRQAKEHAEKLARVKEEFLSNMSHEIRTPLNAVIGFTEQLAASPLTADQGRYVERIQHSGKHLLQLINDILDYAKLESGKLKLEKVGFRPERQLRNIIGMFEEQAATAGLELHLSVDDSVPEIIIGDPVRFSQVIINLVSNAIKFTREGGVNVIVHARKLAGSRISLVITVKDTGIGIAAEKKEQIFQEFAQADSSTTREFGGTGLGLSIVRKIILTHSGHLEVESEVGKGTAFTVSLPYTVGSADDLPVEKTTERQTSLRGRSVLIADDQEFNRELVATILQKEGMEVTACAGGQEAIDAVKTRTFDVILMDIQMPGMSGLEATRAIRAGQGNGAKTPVIALTAGSSDKEKQACRDAGMDEILLKPFSQNDLLQKISSLTATGEENIPDDSIDLTDLLSLANGDNAFVANMLGIFLKNNMEDMETLEEAVRTMDMQRIRALAHKMIPPCRHLGFDRTVVLLRSLEAAGTEGDEERIREIMTGLRTENIRLQPLVEQELRKFTAENESVSRP